MQNVVSINQLDREVVIDNLSDDQLHMIAKDLVNWQSPTRINDQMIDGDGFPLVTGDNFAKFGELQKICWEKFNENPQINSHIRDFMGSLTGLGFHVESDVEEIDNLIRFISEDIRNELHKRMTQFVARSEIEGELFLGMTLHTDGFVEVDFLEPTALSSNGDDSSGIYFHPKKSTIPVLYEFNIKSDNGGAAYKLIPSIYAAYYPQFVDDVVNFNKLKRSNILSTIGRKYKALGGFRTFVVSWDRGFLTKRNVSHIKTTMKWITYYEQLKEWEIDHKKSSGAYLWVVEMEDMKAFRTWLKMTPEEKSASGLSAKKVPGGTVVLPPGVKMQAHNPRLSSISDQDSDIMHMITSGLNKPEDMVTGRTRGDTFSGVKASRGPQADRVKDQTAYFERFLEYDFWRSVFFLHSKMNPKFKMEYKVKKTIGFKNKEPIYKTITVPAYKLIDFAFPQSEIVDIESKARALLGVNHQSVSEVLGIPKELIANMLGFSNYKKLRYKYQDEKDSMPELPLTIDVHQASAAAAQSFKSPNREGEGDDDANPPKDKNPNKDEE